jgi:hypothetical protein
MVSAFIAVAVVRQDFNCVDSIDTASQLITTYHKALLRQKCIPGSTFRDKYDWKVKLERGVYFAIQKTPTSSDKHGDVLYQYCEYAISRKSGAMLGIQLTSANILKWRATMIKREAISFKSNQKSSKNFKVNTDSAND